MTEREGARLLRDWQSPLHGVMGETEPVVFDRTLIQMID